MFCSPYDKQTILHFYQPNDQTSASARKSATNNYFPTEFMQDKNEVIYIWQGRRE